MGSTAVEAISESLDSVILWFRTFVRMVDTVELVDVCGETLEIYPMSFCWGLLEDLRNFTYCNELGKTKWLTKTHHASA